MPMTLEIKIIKNKKNIGNCLYYNYSSIRALEEAKNIIDNYNSELVGKIISDDVFALRLFQKENLVGTKSSTVSRPFIKGLTKKFLIKNYGEEYGNGGVYENGIYFYIVKGDKIHKERKAEHTLTIDFDKSIINANIFDIAKSTSASKVIPFDYLELPFYLLEDLTDFVKENNEWSIGSGYRTCIN